MSKYLLLLVLPVLLVSCKEKKVSLAVNDEKVNISDFLEFFQPMKLPYNVTDTVLRRKEPETSIINAKLFARFVPDSILSRLFGKEQHPHLYAIGKISVPEAEQYLFVKATAKERRALYIFCFDKKNHFAAARPILYSDNEPGVSGQAGMDNKYTLTIQHQRKGPDGQLLYHKDAYIYNGDVGFMLILTESNETKAKIVPVYDPIDTLPRKHKFSGDYAQDKRNIVSIRDGKDASRFWFFVHFEKDNGTCKGELKGEAKFVAPGIARYRAYSDPCAIEFTFIPEGVSLKELGGCGVHRDIKCFFEGYFQRRRTPQKPEHKAEEHKRSKIKVNET
ncbi:hypothetical protein [Puia dinghuensis]|uniref:Lipoprotein n=1 Tax=Puia dinghuensis TaxID=1792502 RepID=A0A8J2U9I2_9BACT|nr:hypothetical protein [Puia dinghuensis]GGA87596.1 hypothetical protein GCM10011511_08490 [Puia dinghuensis]